MQNIYTLRYHLQKTENPRLKQKIKKIVDIIPKFSDNITTTYTKRKIWFLKNDFKFLHVQVGKRLLSLKIRTRGRWNEVKLKEFDDFDLLYVSLEKEEKSVFL